MRALTTAPVVRRLSRRIAASRARTLSWVVSLVSMRVSVALASKRYMGASCETTVSLKGFRCSSWTPITAHSIDFQRAAPVAQGIEQDGPNVKVGGSIPSGGTYVMSQVEADRCLT